MIKKVNLGFSVYTSIFVTFVLTILVVGTVYIIENIPQITTTFSGVNNATVSINNMTQVINRLPEVETKIDGIEKNITSFSDRISKFENRFNDLDMKIDRLLSMQSNCQKK